MLPLERENASLDKSKLWWDYYGHMNIAYVHTL